MMAIVRKVGGKICSSSTRQKQAQGKTNGLIQGGKKQKMFMNILLEKTKQNKNQLSEEQDRLEV